MTASPLLSKLDDLQSKVTTFAYIPTPKSCSRSRLRPCPHHHSRSDLHNRPEASTSKRSPSQAGALALLYSLSRLPSSTIQVFALTPAFTLAFHDAYNSCHSTQVLSLDHADIFARSCASFLPSLLTNQAALFRLPHKPRSWSGSRIRLCPSLCICACSGF